MRTPEQIGNLRRVLKTFVGTYGDLMSDEDVNKWGDALQNNVDSQIVDRWNLRIKTNENRDLEWRHIKPEPTEPTFSLLEMRKKCEQLLVKYPKILAIQIVALNDPTCAKVFEQPSQK